MTHNICNECETVAHCLKHGCIPKVRHYTNTTNPIDFPNVNAGAVINAGDGGYSEGTKAGYDAFVAARNWSRINSAARESGLDVFALGLDHDEWVTALTRYTELVVK